MPYLKPDRSHYIPKRAVRYADKQSSAVVYAYEVELPLANRLYLLGFSGKRQKPDFHYHYGASEPRRQAKAKAHFESVRAREAAVIAQREKDKAEGHMLKVGSILRASWGYDQTNVDFYQVLRLVGAKMVEIVEIESAAIESFTDGVSDMSGKCAPMVGKAIGKPMLKRAQRDCVKIASYCYAYLQEPKMIAGVPTYEASRFSNYA